MAGEIKRFFYFPVAAYFRFFARIRLAIWNPRVIVVTGSSGKTTLLHLIESQLNTRARYSHQANSSFGIPFDILGLRREDLLPGEWFWLFFLAPFCVFKKPFQEKIYIVEADCDRPGEGKFISEFLTPEVTIWTNSSGAHAKNFDTLERKKKYANVEEAIAHEFGYFIEHTTGKAVVNGDSALIASQLRRLKAPVYTIRKKGKLTGYSVTSGGTEFTVSGQKYAVNALLPEDCYYLLVMTLALLDYLSFQKDLTFANFQMPPGRSSVFQGMKETTIIDSSYNSTPDGMRTIVDMFADYPAKNKWAVIGDMIDLGFSEQNEHEKLAELLVSAGLSKIVLVGPRVSRHTYPKLLTMLKDSKKVVRFTLPGDALEYVTTSLKGGETILFKGARFLEGIIEHLLMDKSDVAKLCRREKVWQMRRRAWGL